MGDMYSPGIAIMYVIDSLEYVYSIQSINTCVRVTEIFWPGKFLIIPYLDVNTSRQNSLKSVKIKLGELESLSRENKVFAQKKTGIQYTCEECFVMIGEQSIRVRNRLSLFYLQMNMPTFQDIRKNM